MKWSTCVAALLLGGLVAAAQDEPKKDGKTETVISLADTPKAVADQIKSGSVVNIVIEEAAASPIHTVFVGNRVSAMTEDRRKKDGHTITVYLTPAQAKAFEALKDAGKVIVELHKAP